MNRIPRTILALACCGAAALAQGNPAQQARDRGDVAALSALAEKAEQHAGQAKTAAAWLEATQLEAWKFEAASDRNDTKAAGDAAKAGAAAAQQAVTLAPQSADAHAWLGTMLGEEISLDPTFGGMRYGASENRQLATALQLDPRNVRALVNQGIALLYTPAMFGGSPARALADFEHAVALAPTNDTAHLWLAQAWAQQKQWAKAEQEIAAALRLDPNRMFTRALAEQIHRRGAAK